MPPCSLGITPRGTRSLLAAVWLTIACADIDVSQTHSPAPTPPPADRELWDVRLQLSGPSSEVIVQAPYLSDHLDAQQTRADSGALVLLIDHSAPPDASIVAITDTATITPADTARIRASQLLVDHRNGLVSFSGDVHIDGAALQLQTDSLFWDRDTDSLALPHATTMHLKAGEVRSATLVGTTALQAWQAEDVWASFVVTAATGASRVGESRVGIEGRRATLSVYEDQVTASFDSVTSHWRERRLQCLQAFYDGVQDRVEFRGAVRAQDADGVLQADTVRLDLRTDRLVAVGAIVLEEADRRLTAARLVDDAEGWRAAGAPVRLQVGARQLTAPRIARAVADGILQADGGVEVEEGDSRHLQAARLRLDPASDELFATDVQMQAQQFRGRLSAGWLRSQQGGARVELGDDPRLERQRDDGTVLVLRADTLDLDMDARFLDGRGGFQLQSPPYLKMAAASGSLDAAADSLGLLGHTRLQLHDDGTDLLLEAASVSLELIDGQARNIRWPVALKGRLVDAEQTTWLRADSGELLLRQGRLDSLHLTGSPVVTHRGRGAARASRFSAEQMTLLFAEDGTLRQVEARGSATVLSRIADDEDRVAVNEAKGGQLRIDLLDGAVVSVHLLEQIEGRYLPPDSDLKPDEPRRRKP